jgi:hypothetical protein
LGLDQFLSFKGTIFPTFLENVPLIDYFCRSIVCCAEVDLCNKELSPVYESTREEESESADLVDPAVYHLALLVSLTICLVLFNLLLTLAYLR